MPEYAATAKRVLIVGYLIILHATVIALLAERFLLPKIFPTRGELSVVKDPVTGPQVAPTVLPTELPQPAAEPSLLPSPFPTIDQKSKMIVPVQGIPPEKLFDTFTAARSEGRSHDAIDIPASIGTPVLAASDGEIIKFFDSERGGTTIYQITADLKYFLYYAHLQQRAEGLSEKQFVRQGTTIGYVGDTGNAGPGNYHLHFSITVVSDPNRFWEGVAVNPYPILTGRAELW